MRFTSGLLRNWRPRVERLEDRSVPARLLALTSNDHLLTFDTPALSPNPGTVSIIRNVAVNGLAAGDELGGIAFTEEGRLYGVSINNFSVNHVYQIDDQTARATLLSGDKLGMFTESGRVAVSFDPQTSMMRAIDDFGDNVVVKLTPGGYVIDHTAGEPHFVNGDVNQRYFAGVNAMAYSNQFPGAASTNLYGIATTNQPWLVSIGGVGGNPAADTGQVSSLVAIDSPEVESFTISGKSNTAYWTDHDDLHLMNLDTGASSLLGSFPATALPSHATVRSLASLSAAVLDNPEVSISDAVAVQDAGTQGHAVFTVRLSETPSRPITVHYSTADDTARSGHDYTSVSNTLTFGPGEVTKPISVPVRTFAPAAAKNFFVTISSAAADVVREVGIGTIRAAGQQTFLADQYVEDFSDGFTSSQPSFDTAGVFQHTIVKSLQEHTINSPSDTAGTNYRIDNTIITGNPVLTLFSGIDRITFPNLAAGVHVGFAKIDLPTVFAAEVRVIGLNGSYDVLQDSTSGSVSVGEEHVLPNGLELGPIQEIDLISRATPSAFDNVRILAVPDRPPNANDDFVDTLPATKLVVTPLENDASQDGSPLTLIGHTEALHGHVTFNPTAGHEKELTYTPNSGFVSRTAADADTFTYTVEDALGQRSVGTVHVFVHRPPKINDRTFAFTTGLIAADDHGAGVVHVNDFGGPDTTQYQLKHQSIRYDHPLADGNVFEGEVLNDSGLAIGTFAVAGSVPPGLLDFPITGGSPSTLYSGPFPVSGELNLTTGKVTIHWDNNTLNPNFVTSIHAAFEADAPLEITDPVQGLLTRAGLDPQHDKALLMSGPAHGLLQFHDDGTFIYTPTEHDLLNLPQAVFGTDSFTWFANDGLDSNVATVTINQDGGFVTRTFLFNVDRTFSHVDFVTHGADNIEVGHLHVPLGVTIHVHPSTHSPETFLPAAGLLRFATGFGIPAEDLTLLSVPGHPDQHPQITIKLKTPPQKGSLWTDKGFLAGELQLGPHDPIYTDPDDSGDLNPDGSFWYVPADDFPVGKTDQFTYQIIVTFTANGQSYQVASEDTTVLLSSNGIKGTGEYDGDMQGAPNNGDGNYDGIPDLEEDNVATLRAGANHGYEGSNFITFESPRTAGHPTQLLDVNSYQYAPVTPPQPPGVTFPAGFFKFQVVGLTPGEATTVKLYLTWDLRGDPSTWTLWRLGKTPANRHDHWYQFMYQHQTDDDDASTTGAEFLDSRHILLHFVDGARGDDDLKQDGVITDPGALAFAPAPTASLEPDPAATGKTRLLVTGTPGNDVITLTPVDALGGIGVTVNGQSLGTFQPTGHILVNSLDGDDVVRLKSTTSRAGVRRIGVPAVMLAGNGKDTIDANGSSADNVLVAGTGKSKLIDGFGRDILIGSPQSSFIAARGDNLIIKGVTPFNTDPSALLALLAEWTAPGEKDVTRIDHLLHGGGANGNVVLSDAVVARSARNTLLATPLEQARPTVAGPKGTLPATDTTPNFTWNAVPGADHYRLHVDDLTARKNDVVNLNVTGTTFTPTLPLVQGHTHRWWVQAFDVLGNASMKSAALRFSVTALGKPKLLGPVSASAGTAPTFTWGAVDGADHYQIVLLDATSSRPSLVATSADVAQANWSPLFPLTAARRYRWRVRALGPAGSVGPWSAWAAFTA